jgi:hypothetical protein
MSTIAELEDKVKVLLDEIETLKQKEKAEEFEYPFEYDKKYLVIYHNGDIGVYNWTNHKMDKEAYSQGNAFKTKEEATRERDKRALLTRFRQFRDKCNGDWEPDFDKDSFKFYLSLNHITDVWKIHFSCNLEDFNLFGYFRKESDAKRAIELFGDEIKRLWVEE